MMVGGIVAVAIVIIVFFGAGIAFGVIWIYARSVRMERKPGPGRDDDPSDPDPGQESWPFRQ
jgi:hypothetical protein